MVTGADFGVRAVDTVVGEVKGVYQKSFFMDYKIVGSFVFGLDDYGGTVFKEAFDFIMEPKGRRPGLFY